MGYLSGRVLGQYELSLLGAEPDPRLLFVGPNLAGAVRDLDVDPESFGRWICAHELTHVFQFQGVPWLRDHMSGLLRENAADARGPDREGGRQAACPHSLIPLVWWRSSARVASRRSCSPLSSGR